MDFGTKREYDHVQRHDGLEIFIDPKSAVYLKGTTLEYQDGLNGRGFVFENPNSRNTCGCGESFAV
jgi:iron-sulfur cluster assembly protein